MGKFQNLTGQRFGKLVVLRENGRKGKKIAWECLCDCGNKTTTTSYLLKSGQTKSCGCLNHLPKHNETKTRLYRIYIAMKQRCNNPKNTGYIHYGARGIKVCKQWENDFIEFRNWALSNGYADDLSIDRINVDGNYEPNNCRWCNTKQQNFNKRSIKNKETSVYQTKKTKKWHSTLGHKHLGSFNTKDEAIEAREKAVKKLFETLF